MNTFRIQEPDSDLRASDMLEFFERSGRSTKCPCCSHAGEWEIHIQIDKITGEAESDPLLITFNIETAGNLEEPSKCAGMTCPKCGHFVLISMYKIFASKQAQGDASHG